MKYRILLTLVMVLILASTAIAYSGFNRAYYTHNYQPSVYYANPYVTPTYAATYHYYPSMYSQTYTTTYVTQRFPSYSAYYYPSVTTIYSSPTFIHSPVYSYPTTQRHLSIYRNDSGWGFSFGTSTACGFYGYC